MKNVTKTELVLASIVAIFVLCAATTPLKNIILQSNLDAGGYSITNLATGTNASNAATKGYVDTNFIGSTNIIPVSHGGTGATNASGARTNLGLVIGTDVQPANPNLTDIANLNYTGANYTFPGYADGYGWVIIGVSSFAKSFLDDITAADARDTLGLGTLATQNTSDLTASTVSNAPAGNVTSTTVQGAINELDTKKAALNGATFTGSVGVGGSPASSAAFEVQSTTKGFLPPRMTSTQRNAIASPANGLTVFDTTLGTIVSYISSAWKAVVSGVGDEITFANFSVITMADNTRKAFLKVLGNFSTKKILYVSQDSDATNTRTGISQYNPWLPFSTPEAAVAAATSGDTILVEPGRYIVASSLAKDGVNLQGFRSSELAATANSVILFDDGGSEMHFYVFGFGKISGEGSGNTICKTSNSNSQIYIQNVFQLDADNVLWANGGRIIGDATWILANSGDAITTDSGGYTSFTAHTINSSGGSAIICGANSFQWIRVNDVSADPDYGIYCTGAGSSQTIIASAVHGENAGIKCDTGGTQFVTCQTISGGNYGISNGGGTSIVQCESYNGGIAIESGTGTLSVTANGGVGLIIGGTDASSTLDLNILNKATTSGSWMVLADQGKLVLNGRFVTEGSTDPTIRINSSSTGLILRNCVLVADPTATNSIEKVTGTPTIKVYQAVANKPVGSGITQQVSTVLVDSNVE